MENVKKKKSGHKGRGFMPFLLFLLALAIAAGAFASLQLVNPYALTVDGKEILYVKDKEAGDRVVRQIIEAYQSEGTEVQSISLDKKISSERVMLWDDYDEKKLMSTKEAVNYIKEENGDGKPLFTATIVGTKTGEEKYVPDIVYEKDETMFAGDSEVKKEGESGLQKVTRDITTVNGEETGNEIIDSEILEEGEAKVVVKGTRGLPEGEDWKTYEGEPVFADGQAMVDYSYRYMGAPYKYGGYSFKTGIDCVQFVRAMYKKYGITLPNNHTGIRASGKGVSLKSAKPGDVVCYRHHVAIYIGGGKVINATRKRGIAISTVTPGKVITVRRIVD